jgi:phospholipase C
VYNPNNLQIALCPQYSYVIRSDLQPYFDIATSYHFANYMFQTNEGPSFPAHQFILSGTSAPAAPGLTNYLDFVAENAGFDKSGCPDTSQHPAWVDPTGFESLQPHQSECYDHPALGDQLKANNITWRYYTPTPGVIWTAPAAISSLCGKIVNGIRAGPDFANVIWPGKNGLITPAKSLPILSDIQNCQLQQMSRVIPEYAMSDHPFPNIGGKGPSSVANLVDAIGDSACKDSKRADLLARHRHLHHLGRLGRLVRPRPPAHRVQEFILDIVPSDCRAQRYGTTQAFGAYGYGVGFEITP